MGGARKTTLVDRIETSVIDENGVIKEQHVTEGTRTLVKQEPGYIKLYIEDMLYISDMPKKLSGLTWALLKRATYADAEEGLCVSLNSYVKEKILKEMDLQKMQSLNNSISKLCKGGILKRLGSGTYQFNPYLFGKGEWKDISNIRVTWDYNEMKNRTFQTYFAYKTQKDGQITMEFGDENE